MTLNENLNEEIILENKIAKLDLNHENPCKDLVAKLDGTQHDGSDSGVEMTSRCSCHHNVFDADAETDSYSTISSCAQSTSPYFVTDVVDLITNRHLTPGDSESIGESLISYDAASENGSESSSVDDTKKCRPNCINLQKVYCTKTNCCRSAPVNRSKLTAFSNDPNFRYGSRQSSLTKCAQGSESPRNSPTERSRTLRSYSGTRTRVTMSPDETKWSLDGRTKSKLLPYNSGDGKITYDMYATLPRRKKETSSENRSPREPSLNRAASLRKKFLENSLITTSLNSSMTTSQTTKTMPPYVKSRTKTKIYHEAGTQTALTNGDVDHALADSPFQIFNERVSAQVDDREDKRTEEQMGLLNDELKKLKKENTKQRTVIEWLEGELSAAKDEKNKMQNRLAALEQRIYNLLIHKGAHDDVVSQLEKEVSCSNNVISRQQKEITELQQLCCIMQKDLDNMQMAQKANEMESLELQEFLQAEKSALTDSLKDLENETESCKIRIKEYEQELISKNDEFINLSSETKQLKQENQTMKAQFNALECRYKELLVHQGSVTSSASVALSGLSSRFEQLLEQLTSAYNFSDSDLQNNFIHSDGPIRDNNLSDDNSSTNTTEILPLWLQAVSTVMFKTSEKQDCINASDSLSRSKSLIENSVCKNIDQKFSNCRFTNCEDSFYSSKFEEDSRRNSILSDVYTNDDNLTLDFNINESFNDLSESLMHKNLEKFRAESFNTDVSMVEQVVDIDNLVLKVFKIILFIQLHKLN